MPRKNHKQKIKLAPYEFKKSTRNKKRYGNRAEAQKVADYQMALDLNLELFVLSPNASKIAGNSFGVIPK